MTGTVVAVSSGTGGVGQTTTSINLASGVRMATHRSTAVVDLGLAMVDVLDSLDLDFDPQSDITFHDVLAGNAAVTDAVFEGPGGIHVIPSDPDLDGYAASNPEDTNATIETLREEYDLVFLDTPAGVSYGSLLAMGLADVVVLVSSPRLASVRDTEKTKQLADRMITPVIGVIFVKAGAGGAPEVDRIANYLGVGCLGQVPAAETTPDADAGHSVFLHEIDSDASQAYWNIAEDLLRKLTSSTT